MAQGDGGGKTVPALSDEELALADAAIRPSPRLTDGGNTGDGMAVPSLTPEELAQADNARAGFPTRASSSPTAPAAAKENAIALAYFLHDMSGNTSSRAATDLSRAKDAAVNQTEDALTNDTDQSPVTAPTPIELAQPDALPLTSIVAPPAPDGSASALYPGTIENRRDLSSIGTGSDVAVPGASSTKTRDDYFKGIGDPVALPTPANMPDAPERDTKGDARKNAIGAGVAALLARLFGGDAATAGAGFGAYTHAAHGAQDEAYNQDVATYDKQRDNTMTANAQARQSAQDSNANLSARREAAETAYTDDTKQSQFEEAQAGKADIAQGKSAATQTANFEKFYNRRLAFIADQSPDAQANSVDALNKEAATLGSGFFTPVPGTTGADGNLIPPLTMDAMSQDKVSHAGLSKARAANVPAETAIKREKVDAYGKFVGNMEVSNAARNANNAQRNQNTADYNAGQLQNAARANEIRMENVKVARSRADAYGISVRLQGGKAVDKHKVEGLINQAVVNKGKYLKMLDQARPKSRWDGLTQSYVPPSALDNAQYEEYAVKVNALIEQQDGLIQTIQTGAEQAMRRGSPAAGMAPAAGGPSGYGQVPGIQGIQKDGLPPMTGNPAGRAATRPRGAVKPVIIDMSRFGVDPASIGGFGAGGSLAPIAGAGPGQVQSGGATKPAKQATTSAKTGAVDPRKMSNAQFKSYYAKQMAAKMGRG